MVALESLCDLLTDGTHYTPHDISEGMPFLTVVDMRPEGLNFKTCSRISLEDFAEADRQNSAPRKGDVLFSKDGTVGKVHVVADEEKFAVLSSIAIIRPDPERLDSRYLAHFLKTPLAMAAADQSKTGSALRRIILKDIRRIQLSPPSLTEQKRIASILDQADRLRTAAIKAQKIVESLPEALFFGLFGDPESPLVGEKVSITSVADLINGDRSKNYPSGDDIKTQGVLFLNTSNLVGGRINLNKCNFITPEKFSSLSRGKLARGDIIITLRGTLGQCALFECAENTGFINAQMLIIRSREGIIPRFLLEVLRFRSVQARLQRENSGTAVPQLTAAQISRFKIPVPPIDWQRQFVDAVDKVANNLRLLEQRSARMSLLFTSLQYRAFRGEL